MLHKAPNALKKLPVLTGGKLFILDNILSKAYRSNWLKPTINQLKNY
jgi:hypothetical protein